jgi:hypothetical protein
MRIQLQKIPSDNRLPVTNTLNSVALSAAIG